MSETKAVIKRKLTIALNAQRDLQAQLIEAQQKIIALQDDKNQLLQQIAKSKPPTPKDDVHWYHVSNGKTSDQVVASGDPKELAKLQEWVFMFGEKYIKPYVHPEAYAEMIGHMTRGFSSQLARAEVLAEFGDVLPEGKTIPFQSLDLTEPPEAE